MKKRDKIDILVEVASLYYEHNLTQSQIAQKGFTSRSSVSRLLKQAREEGIVEIIIHYPNERNSQLENRIRDIFRLKEVRILKSRNRTEKEVIKALGELAAEYLDNILNEDDILGVSWGRTIYQTVRELKPEKKHNVDVVQIMGVAGTEDPVIDASELIRKIAKVYGGKFHTLHAPLYVKDDYVRESLINDATIKDTLDLARKADVVLTGIGVFGTAHTNSLWQGYINKKEKTELKKQGLVGYLGAHFYDINGKEINNNINKKVIALELEEMRNIKNVIAVAGGEYKAEAILGAIRGNYINTLILDDAAAMKILELDKKTT